MPVYHTAAGTVEMLEWGDGPELLVLLHAAAAGPQSLAALAAMLVRPGRRVIAPALDRYGATVMRDGTDRLRAHVGVVRVCVERHPAERRILFGHSMGGLVGLLSAMDGVPFDAMALYEPIVIGCLRPAVPEEVALRDWDRAIVAEVAHCIAAGDTESGIAAFVTAWNEVAWSALPAGVRARLLTSAVALAADMHAVSFCDLAIDRIARMPIPVMLLQGVLSPAITHAMTARLGALLPESRCVAIPGCGHMGPAQNPMAIASTLCFSPSEGDCAAELHNRAEARCPRD